MKLSSPVLCQVVHIRSLPTLISLINGPQTHPSRKELAVLLTLVRHNISCMNSMNQMKGITLFSALYDMQCYGCAFPVASPLLRNLVVTESIYVHTVHNNSYRF